MKKIYVLVTAFIMLLMVGDSGAASREKGLTVSVMSFNIRYATTNDGDNQWRNRKNIVCDIIRQHSPDVIGLQEALRGQLDELRNALPEYNEVGAGRNGDTKGEYSAILYRTSRFKMDKDDSGTFWLSDTPEKPSCHWGNAFTRVCTWARLVDKSSGQSFYLYNTHLDHKSQPSREKSVRLIISRIQKRKHQDPFVLTGDFNAEESNPAIEYLKGTDGAEDSNPVSLIDSFRVLHPAVKDAGTFNGFIGTSKGAKIDYIFIMPDTHVLDASIDRTAKEGRYPSDHFPVTARLQFGNDGQNQE